MTKLFKVNRGKRNFNANC